MIGPKTIAAVIAHMSHNSNTTANVYVSGKPELYRSVSISDIVLLAAAYEWTLSPFSATVLCGSPEHARADKHSCLFVNITSPNITSQY